MRSMSSGLFVLVFCFGWSAAAGADEIAVLTVGFGEEPAALLGASVRRAAAGLDAVVATDQQDVDARVAARYAEPTGVDGDWVTLVALRGEEAYYAMNYGAAAAVFETDDWRAVQGAIVDMALEPSLAESVRRSLMIRAAARFYSEESAQTEAAIREVVTLFPEWSPDIDWYQPELVVGYADVRQDVLRDAGTLVITSPGGSCTFSLNGHVLGQGSQARSAALDAPYAAVVSCPEQTSRVHVVRAGDVVIDPRFDAAFDPVEGHVTLSDESGGRADELAATARAWANVVGAERVVMAGVLPSGELELVEVAIGDDDDAGYLRAVRAHPDEGGAFDVPGAVRALLNGTPVVGVEVGDRIEDRLVFPGDATVEDSGSSAAPWIAFGIGGAGLITGTVFAIIESSRFEDYESCQDDATCFSGPELDELEASRDQAALGATIGFGVGLAGIVTGAILLAVLGGNEADRVGGTEEIDETTTYLPRVTGAVTEGGGWMGVGFDW